MECYLWYPIEMITMSRIMANAWSWCSGMLTSAYAAPYLLLMVFIDDVSSSSTLGCHVHIVWLTLEVLYMSWGAKVLSFSSEEPEKITQHCFHSIDSLSGCFYEDQFVTLHMFSLVFNNTANVIAPAMPSWPLIDGSQISGSDRATLAGHADSPLRGGFQKPSRPK